MTVFKCQTAQQHFPGIDATKYQFILNKMSAEIFSAEPQKFSADQKVFSFVFFAHHKKRF